MNKTLLFPSESKQIHIALIWLVLVLVSLFSRSYLPIDETRYVTVAWNMYLNHDYLVPYLNGDTYSHKPPLLFWLMNIGWQIFGVSEWWPRLLPSLFAMGALLITQKIALRLWPTQKDIAYVSSMVLLGSGMWAVFTTATMFDMLVAFFTVLGAWDHVVIEMFSKQDNRGNVKLQVSIQDNGHGFDVKKASGFGLAGMKERFEGLNGELAILSNSSGTIITALVPIGK